MAWHSGANDVKVKRVAFGLRVALRGRDSCLQYQNAGLSVRDVRTLLATEESGARADTTQARRRTKRSVLAAWIACGHRSVLEAPACPLWANKTAYSLGDACGYRIVRTVEIAVQHGHIAVVRWLVQTRSAVARTLRHRLETCTGDARRLLVAVFRALSPSAAGTAEARWAFLVDWILAGRVVGRNRAALVDAAVLSGRLSYVQAFVQQVIEHDGGSGHHGGESGTPPRVHVDMQSVFEGGSLAVFNWLQQAQGLTVTLCGWDSKPTCLEQGVVLTCEQGNLAMAEYLTDLRDMLEIDPRPGKDDHHRWRCSVRRQLWPALEDAAARGQHQLLVWLQQTFYMTVPSTAGGHKEAWRHAFLRAAAHGHVRVLDHLKPLVGTSDPELITAAIERAVRGGSVGAFDTCRLLLHGCCPTAAVTGPALLAAFRARNFRPDLVRFLLDHTHPQVQRTVLAQVRMCNIVENWLFIQYKFSVLRLRTSIDTLYKL